MYYVIFYFFILYKVYITQTAVIFYLVGFFKEPGKHFDILYYHTPQGLAHSLESKPILSPQSFKDSFLKGH